MKVVLLPALTLLAATLALACGGEVAGIDPDAGASSDDESAPPSHDASSKDAPSKDTSAPDVPPFVGQDTGAAVPKITCTLGGSGGSGSVGGGTCNIQASETCSDGMTYTTNCSCPAATCFCSESSANGGSSSGGIPFSGCADNCSPDSIPLTYEACGFPH
jgi:hypothetical protein